MKKIYFLITLVVTHESVFCQNISFQSDNINIIISLKIQKNKIYQSWKIINFNDFPIYFPSYNNNNTNLPRYEAAQIGNEVVVRVGGNTLSNGIPLEVSTDLMAIERNDSIKFTVAFDDFRFKTKLTNNSYKKLVKNISIDYLTQQDVEKIFGSHTPMSKITGNNYSKFARYISFKFSNIQ